MCYLERFDIDLKALTDEVTPLSWELDDQFFESLEGAQLQGGSLHVSGSIRKATGFYELQLHTDGTVLLRSYYVKRFTDCFICFSQNY